jgi:uncharacterized caspase-like protein
MNKAISLIVFGLSLMSMLVSAAYAERRLALVVGNSAYEHAAPLKNTTNDAEAVAALFARLGFEVLKGIDLKDREFGRIVGEFSERLDQGADNAVFYYAGHGLQVGGENYLAPVDAKLERESSLDFEAIRLKTILKSMERRKRTNLLFLDSCRDNPLATNLARNMGTRSTAIGRGLARVESGVGTMIAYATQPGNVALDGSGDHSPFTNALLEHSEKPGLEIEALMRLVRKDVIEVTGGSQVPWNHSSLTTSFRFVDELKPSSKSTVKPTLSGSSSVSTKAIELSFWESIRSSDNAALYKEYLRKFPNGSFAFIANSKLNKLTKKSQLKLAALPKTLQEEDIANGRPDVRSLTRSLQSELNRVGCNSGTVDGMWGRKGKTALARFNRYANTQLQTAAPSELALRTVKSRKKMVCPKVANISTGKASKPNAGSSPARSKNSSARSNFGGQRSRGAGCRAGNMNDCKALCASGSQRACYAVRCMRGNRSACSWLRSTRR